MIPVKFSDPEAKLLPLIEEQCCPGCGELSVFNSEKSKGSKRYFLCPNCGLWRYKNAAAVALGRRGGAARALSLSPEDKKRIAKAARQVGIANYLARLDSNKTIREKRMQQAVSKGVHTAREWVSLIRFCGEKCVKCGVKGKKLTKDHIIPVSMNGSDRIDNLQPLCWDCNRQKHTYMIDYRPAGWWKAI